MFPTHPTIFTHFYNEEFLLPLWLTHHKKYFHYGVLIDYGSTDRSVEIIKDICPHWTIIKSENPKFDAIDCDREIMNYENQLPIGLFRIAITCTEFVVGDVNKLMSTTFKQNGVWQWLLPVTVFSGYDPNGSLSNTIPLWEQVKMGIPWEKVNHHRSLHNYPGVVYTGGRHYHGPINQTDAAIFKYSNVLVGKEMIQRRLQITDRVSERDREAGWAQHNSLTTNSMEQWYKTNIESQNPVDCSEYIDEIIKPKQNTTFVFSNKPEKFPPIQKSVEPEKIQYFDGSNIGNFSKIINKCVESSKTEVVILCSDKVLPSYRNINKMITLLNMGYAFVGLYKFALFGFKKELLRKIGVFDERFLSGGNEDMDFLLRLKEANLSIYISSEAEYTPGTSSWDYSQSWLHWCSKWTFNEEEGTVKRELEEISHSYNFGPSVPTNFLNFDRSIISNDPMCNNVRLILEKNFTK